MLQTLRKNMRHIMLVVAIAFIATIIFEWGMGGFKNRSTQLQSGIIAVINGQNIMYQDFAQMVEQQIQSMKDQHDRESLSDYEIQSVRTRVWKQMLQEVLITQEVQRLGINPSNKEIVFNLSNNPPEFLRTHENFQTDGQFDLSKYQQALSDPNNYKSWIPVENYLRNTLPMQKVSQWIASTVRISESEILDALQRQNSRVNVQYVLFNPSSYPIEGIVIPDAAIEKYYTSHSDEFMDSEKRKIKYIQFELNPSEEDTAQLYLDAQDLIDRIHVGEDFSQLAIDYSEDAGTAQNGGDLGFFSQGDMVKPFEDAAFSAKVGDLVGPVKSIHGLHIIKVEARKYTDGDLQVQARHILLKFEASSETYDKAMDAASFFSDELKETESYTFDSLAKREGFAITESPLFQKGGFIPGLGMTSTIKFLIFREDLGYVSRPLTVDKKIIVFQIAEIVKAHVKPFDDVKNQILTQLQRDKQKLQAQNDCKTFSEKLKSQDFESAVNSDSLQISETGLFALNASIPSIGQDPVFAGTAFKLPQGEISAPFEGNRGWYLLKVIEKQDAPQEPSATEKQTIRQELENQKMNQVLSRWMQTLENKAKIEDYREEYF